MLNYINGASFSPKINNINQNNQPRYSSLSPLRRDTVSFRGMSAPSTYKSVFHYLGAEIIKNNTKKYGVDGSILSSNNIENGIKTLFQENKVYTEPVISNYRKIKWKNYVPQDVREFATNKINEARISRLDQWKTFLESPESHEEAKNNSKLVKNLTSNPSLKLVIWNAINSELKENNRHIPVPLDLQALSETIHGFKKIESKDRAVRCASPSFLDIYTHRLRDNLLVEKGLSDNKSIWIKVPSIKHDKDNKSKNIETLEILSCKNWCTRSSLDKAQAALEDGDFHVYLERDKNNLWQPLVGMASEGNKIDQIQGVENNNIIPLNQFENIKKYITDNGIKCQSAIVDEGPKAYQQILIREKLNENRPELGKSFDRALREEDTQTIYNYLNKPAKTLEDGKLQIKTYKPAYLANANSGISIPYSMIGISEDAILKDVKVIDGDMILDDKNKLFSSSITTFPPSLEKVKGKIICSKEQYEKYGEDLQRVAKNGNGKVVVY